MVNHKSLWVVWQNKDTRLHYHIGTLSYYNNQYEFRYTWQSESNQKVKAALENGYMLHPAFPHLEKIYTSKVLFPAFDRRLPSEIRADYDHILNELKLDHTASKMDILERTRGKLANDFYTFEKPLKVKNNKLVTSFYIHGMRYQENLPANWADILRTTNKIYLKLESDNMIDKNAIAVYGGWGTKLGYVPRFYTTGLSALLSNNIKTVVNINYINEKATPDWWVQVNFECDMNDISPKELKELDSILEYAV